MTAQELIRELTRHRGAWSDRVDTIIVTTINCINSGLDCSDLPARIQDCINNTVDYMDTIWNELSDLNRAVGHSIRRDAAQVRWNQAMKDLLFLRATENILRVHEGDESCTTFMQDYILQADKL